MGVIVGARCGNIDVKYILNRVNGLSREIGSEIIILDASIIQGKEHVEVAIEKAERAFRQGRNISNKLSTEIMVYAAAERQISRAIGQTGMNRETNKLAIVILDDEAPGRIQQVIDELGWKRDDSVLEPDSNHALDEVLEKMALSELER